MEKMDKVLSRQKAIKKLIKKHLIEDQKTLVELLKDEFGIDTNQSIVSRDLTDLGVGKHKVNNKMVYELKELDVKKEILRLAITDIKHNESLVVIYTLAGLAPFVGDCLDQEQEIDALAALAGENVVFVAPKSMKDIRAFFERVCAAMHFKRKIPSD